MKDILIGIDAGTSVIKSVAFSLNGEQLAICSLANEYHLIDQGGVEQDLDSTWDKTFKTLSGLAEKIPDLPSRLAAIAITGQGDGTWLIDEKGKSVGPAWLWLDSRAGQLAKAITDSEHDKRRFHITGTGLNACQQGPQLMFMQQHKPELLNQSETAFHCKDWLYFNLTGKRATDPSEGSFTFGDYRTLDYSDEVIDLLGLTDLKRLLPPIVDGATHSDPLSKSAAELTGFLEGTPVILGYVDIVCTALGAGLYDPVHDTGCTIVGSTGVHIGLARTVDDVILNGECSGYTMPMPISGVYANLQSNMSSTLNIDWLLDTAAELVNSCNASVTRDELISRIDEWAGQADPASVLYQPYISEAGERGPFSDTNARAGFIGLSSQHRFPDLVRSVLEGLAYASRDCYEAMGRIPREVRLTGGAAKSSIIRSIFGSVLGTVIRTSERKEAGAAGAAMMAAVNIGVYPCMDDCVSRWVKPLLGEAEPYDAALHTVYQNSFSSYVDARKAIAPVWKNLNSGASR